MKDESIKTFANVQTSNSGGVTHMSAAGNTRAPRPSVILKRVVNNLPCRQEFERATTNTRLLRVVSLNLARYLTESVPSVNSMQPLLARCIETAVNNWTVADTERKTEVKKVYAYLRGMLYPLPEALEWSVSQSHAQGSEIWKPLEQCLTDWWGRYGGIPEAKRRSRPIDSTYVGIHPADYRLVVLIRFIAKDSVPLAPFAAHFDDLVRRYG